MHLGVLGHPMFPDRKAGLQRPQRLAARQHRYPIAGQRQTGGNPPADRAGADHADGHSLSMAASGWGRQRLSKDEPKLTTVRPLVEAWPRLAATKGLRRNRTDTRSKPPCNYCWLEASHRHLFRDGSRKGE